MSTATPPPEVNPSVWSAQSAAMAVRMAYFVTGSDCLLYRQALFVLRAAHAPGTASAARAEGAMRASTPPLEVTHSA